MTVSLNGVIEKVKLAIADFLQANPSKTVRDITIACYGLAFKPDIDDLRESPSMHIALQISNFHAGKVVFVEPNIEELPAKIADKVLVEYPQAFSSADIHLLLVDHKQFKVNKPNSGYVVDTKGVWL